MVKSMTSSNQSLQRDFLFDPCIAYVGSFEITKQLPFMNAHNVSSAEPSTLISSVLIRTVP